MSSRFPLPLQPVHIYLSLSLSLLFLISHTPNTLAAELCYYPNGEYSEETPCNLTAEVSHCCDSLDKCLSNGLCIWNATEHTGISYVRGTCTDHSWTDPLCPRQCLLNQDTPTNPSAYDFRASGVLVLECGAQGYATEAEYCCESRGEGTRCCATSTAVFRLHAATKGAFTGYSSTSFTSPTTSLPATSASLESSSRLSFTTTSPTSTADPRGSNSDSSGVKIGAGIGGAVAGCLALVALILIFRWRRKKPRDEDVHAQLVGEASKHGGENDALGKAEMDAQGEVIELPARERLHELPAGAGA